VDDLIVKYDTGGNGKLESNEMHQLIMQLNKGEAPSEEEVKMITDSVDRRGGKDKNDGAVDKDELKEVLLEWRNYKEHAEVINEKFKQYDTNGQGTLDRIELAALLKDLNEGQEVTEEDLDMVIGFSDKGEIKDGEVDKTELVQAVAAWFSSCDPDLVEIKAQPTFNDGKPAEAAPPSPEAAPASSACCIIV